MTGTQTLQGWKEIAAWLGRDERTAKRWEKQRGLPVRRTPGSGRANVFCLVSELEAWLVSARNAEASDTPPHDAAPPVPSAELVADVPVPSQPPAQPVLAVVDVSPEAEPAPGPLPVPSPILHVRFPHLLASLAAVLLLALLLSSARLMSRGRPAARHAASPQVRELTLEAAYLAEQRTPASLARSEQDLHTAIQLDPAFAPAYSGLAQTLLLLREYSDLSPQVAYERAAEAADRAIALDPNLADAHTARAFIDFFYHWQPAVAEQQFRTALALDPRSGVAHHWYGSMLLHQGRYDQAVVELNQARALQPSSPAILATTVLALGLGGHRSEALHLAQATLALQPESACMHRALAVISLASPRDIPTYLAELRRFSTISHDRHTLHLLEAGQSAFQGGSETALWRAMLAQEQQLSSGPTAVTADLHAALGEQDLAVDDLSALADRRDPATIGIAMDPLLSDLRSSGRLRGVALRMHLDLDAGQQLVASSPASPALP